MEPPRPNTPTAEQRCKSESATKSLMDNLLGLLRIRVKRGINLAVRDVRSSDPYVVIKMDKQRLKTRVIRKDVNPEWNEDLTLSITDPDHPISLIWWENVKLHHELRGDICVVYDHDTFSKDDPMGEAEFDAKPFLRALELKRGSLPNGTIMTRIQPCRSNSLAEESCVVYRDGNLVQDMLLRLKNVECGEVELQLQWIDLPTTSNKAF